LLAQFRHLRYFLLAGLSRFDKEKGKETGMTDKPTTPDPAEGARPRKRQAPTIDLTATEVAENAATETPAAAASDANANAAHSSQGDTAELKEDTVSEKKVGGGETARGAPASRHVVGAGFAGAAIMTLVLVAIWFAGLVPARDVAPASVDSPAMAALNDRIGKIESSLAKLPASDATTGERLAAVDNAVKSVGAAGAALSKRSDETATIAAEARARADSAEKAVTELRNSLQDLSKNASAAPSAAEVDVVQKRLAAMEQAIKNAPTDRAARLAVSAAALRDAVASGAPFTVELDEVKSLGADDRALTPLAPFAASGVPQAAALAADFRAVIPAMLKVSGAQAPTAGLLERLEANAAKLVRIRPLDAPVGDDPSTVLTRIEFEASRADIDGLLSDLGKLDAATRAPAQAWIARAQARQAAIAAARQLAIDTSRALAKR